jgi:hypothetical protein
MTYDELMSALSKKRHSIFMNVKTLSRMSIAERIDAGYRSAEEVLLAIRKEYEGFARYTERLEKDVSEAEFDKAAKRLEKK